MTMKKTILFLLILALVGQMTAQQTNSKKRGEAVAIGIRVGGNLASYSYPGNEALNTLPFDSLMNRVRPVLGLNVEIPLFNGMMYVAPEVAFTGRGDSRLFHSDTWNADVRYQAKVNYLEARLPISVAIPATSWFKPYVFAAPSFSLALDTVGPMISSIEQYSLDSPQSFNHQVAVDSSNMAPYDYGVTVGAGLRFLIDFNSFAMVVKLEGGYHLGLRDTYSEQEHLDQAQALNVNAYNINGNRLNRGIEASLTIAIPLDFHSSDDCFYWSDVQRKKNRSRGLFGF